MKKLNEGDKLRELKNVEFSMGIAVTSKAIPVTGSAGP
jgi:hypothetical protein